MYIPSFELRVLDIFRMCLVLIDKKYMYIQLFSQVIIISTLYVSTMHTSYICLSFCHQTNNVFNIMLPLRVSLYNIHLIYNEARHAQNTWNVDNIRE